MNPPYSNCHRCGGAYSDITQWPRRCDSCGSEIWRPISPVAVALVPVSMPDGRVGILTGLRAIEPRKGYYGLPGGFVEFGENGEPAAIRETFEEMGITIQTVTPWYTFADQEGHFLMFFVADAIPYEEVVASFKPSPECTEYKIEFGPAQLSFESHTEALTRYFK